MAAAGPALLSCTLSITSAILEMRDVLHRSALSLAILRLSLVLHFDVDGAVQLGCDDARSVCLRPSHRGFEKCVQLCKYIDDLGSLESVSAVTGSD